jgi:hypothetical protein
MAHEAHNDAKQQEEKKSVVSFRSSFWFVIILVGLFIAALNFVSVESSDSPESSKISEESKPVETPMEATSSQTLSGEKGLGKAEDSAAKAQTTTPDSTQSKK